MKKRWNKYSTKTGSKMNRPIISNKNISKRTKRWVRVTIGNGQSLHLTTPRKVRKRRSTRSNTDDFDKRAVRRECAIIWRFIIVHADTDQRFIFSEFGF